MPKPRKFEFIPCTHFTWRLANRAGVWYADGRSNRLNAGRHSLGTRDREEALRLLVKLDTQRAADLGLITLPKTQEQEGRPVPLKEGRELYEEYKASPGVVGGVRGSTRKRYRAVFDKFLPYAQSIGICNWNEVDRRVLQHYIAYLARTGYRTPTGRRKEFKPKTLETEVITIKQMVGWLVDEKYLSEEKRIQFPMKKAESERPYCWKSDEVAAMLEYCRKRTLQWIQDVITGLACTGLRISELASLRWSDIDFEKQHLSLTDETSHSERKNARRRQTKSGRSRSFPIHPDLMAVLRCMTHMDGFVFHGPRGGRLKADTVRNSLIDKVLTPLEQRFSSPEDEKGFKDGRLHSFRHYFCSSCANQGVPERMVMEWLGHKDSTMVRHYYHMNDTEARRQMDRLDLLGDAGKQSTGNLNRTAKTKMEDSPGRQSTSIAP